ncbi:hypothetical protein G7051_15660 [Dysgonomonas sp. HDW5B]|uniref:hypothetical protein n=1 Tax=Dysgonomonas sp. HDW5B TaxID=2714927 RepID=UPI00140B0C77|nr:hypothetical protein [Dysgonomonas sp. HDW5B]QIK55707.1 hypothetical protein G7051_15660 [Dysgonomonas sp. HDW5B]
MFNLISAITNITNLFLEGFNSYKNIKKDTFYNFIEPAFKDFEKVHENYLLTIRNYIEIINANEFKKNTKHPLLIQVQHDSLFSSHLRHQVILLSDVVFKNIKNEEISFFSFEIFKYLDQSYYDLQDLFNFEEHSLNSFSDISEETIKILSQLNHARGFINQSLIYISKEKITSKQKKEKMIDLLEHMVNKLQWKYEDVLHYYNATKVQLLK